MKALLITVLVLVLLVVGVDIAGRQIAQAKAADAIAAQSPTTGHPDVTIHGFSFLAQALPGHYSHITVASGALALGPVTGVDAGVDLYNVTYPLSDALSGSTEHFVAERAELRATVPLTALTSALGVPNVTLSAGPAGTLRLSVPVTVAGHSIPVTADLTATLDGKSLTLTTTDITAAGVTLPAAATNLVRNISLTLPLDQLPISITSASLTASGSSAVITAAANQVSLANLR